MFAFTENTTDAGLPDLEIWDLKMDDLFSPAFISVLGVIGFVTLALTLFLLIACSRLIKRRLQNGYTPPANQVGFQYYRDMALLFFFVFLYV